MNRVFFRSDVLAFRTVALLSGCAVSEPQIGGPSAIREADYTTIWSRQAARQTLRQVTSRYSGRRQAVAVVQELLSGLAEVDSLLRTRTDGFTFPYTVLTTAMAISPAEIKFSRYL